MTAGTERPEATKTERKRGNYLTRSGPFRRLTEWAFATMDANDTGYINKTELYAGFLLVHLNLAKYAGPAACYPPPRSVVDELFEASDDDSSGGIDQAEFDQIMVILCSQVTSRIAVYYGILILLVPYLTQWVLGALDVVGVDDAILKFDHFFAALAPSFMKWLVALIPESIFGQATEQIIALLLFFLVIPVLFNKIDRYSRATAERHIVVYEVEEDPLVAGEKKDD